MLEAILRQFETMYYLLLKHHTIIIPDKEKKSMFKKFPIPPYFVFLNQNNLL